MLGSVFIIESIMSTVSEEDEQKEQEGKEEETKANPMDKYANFDPDEDSLDEMEEEESKF